MGKKKFFGGNGEKIGSHNLRPPKMFYIFKVVKINHFED